MSYFPILNAPGCEGYTTLSNFPPNNWEIKTTGEKHVSVTWICEDGWRSEGINHLPNGHVLTVKDRDVSEIVPEDCLPLLSLTTNALPSFSKTLPQLDSERAVVPAWRATVGLSTSRATTSYQGELDPFPPLASLLTFCPFMQFSEQVSNYLILLNIESSPDLRTSKVEIYRSEDAKACGVFEAKNNASSVICLDGLGFGPNDLPLVICRSMAAIPLYFSSTSDGSHLSLEHTHPPASLVIHGKRWQAQKILKDLWYSKTEQSC